MRFYFHLLNDMGVRDEEGKELPNLAAAQEYARHNARELMGEMLKGEAHINLSHRIDIEDEHRHVLDTVWFRDVVQVEGR
jgi:hypothetical protein